MDRADFQALARDLPEAREELNCLAQLMGNQSNLQREIRGQSAEVRSRQTWGVCPLLVRLLSAEYLGQSIDFSEQKKDTHFYQLKRAKKGHPLIPVENLWVSYSSTLTVR